MVLYGIAIQMYFVDHPPPHFKAVYGEFEANVSIGTGSVIDGRLPSGAGRLVREWTDFHRTELMANWEQARAHGTLERIPGLDAYQGR